MFFLSDAALCLFGIAAGYVHASIVESWSHERIQHARKQTLTRCKRIPLVGASIENAWRSHTVAHHGLSFRHDHITQFQCADEEVRARTYFNKNHLPLTNEYGLTVSLVGFLRMMIPFMLLNTVVAITAPSIIFTPFALMSLTPALLSTFVHPYLHMAFQDALTAAPWPIGFLLRSPLGSKMWVHHFLHHRHPKLCFNLGIPIGDWLRGVSCSPNASDLVELKRIGGPPRI